MIIFPAVYIENVILFHSLKSMDLQKVLVICKKGFLNKFNIKGNFIVDNFKSTEIIIRKIEDWADEHGADFTGVIGVDDEEQFGITARIAGHFGLEFYSEASRNIASNKYIMKSRFIETGVPTGGFILFPDESGKISDIGFPNVLKLITGTGSEFNCVNNDEKELKQNLGLFEEAAEKTKTDKRFEKLTYGGKEFNPRKQFLLEEYLRGREYSCDFMADRGMIKLLRVTEKFDSGNYGIFGGFRLLNRESIKKEGISITELEEVCSRIVDALKISSGVCMVDFKLDEGEMKVIETSIRPGLSAFVSAMENIYGYTSLGVLAKLRIGESFDMDIPDDEGIVVHLLAEKKGIIKKLDISALERQKKDLGISYIFLYNRKGDRIKAGKTDSNGLLVGYVVVRNSRNENTEEISRKIRENVKIEMG